MGIIEKQVMEHEKEKHIDTLEFIKTLLWYMDSTEKERREFIEAQSNINAAYKARMKEILEEKSDLNEEHRQGDRGIQEGGRQMSGNDNSEVKVLVDLNRYEELIRKEEHYDNIVRAAIRGVKLSTWRDRGYDVDMDEVQYYIMIVERDQLDSQKNMLELAQRFNDKSETITIKEGEV